MTLRDRIGIDIGRKLKLEDAISWAAEHSVGFIDVQLDTGANALGTIDAARGAAVRRMRAARHPSRPAHGVGRQCRRIRTLCLGRGRALPRSLCRCLRPARGRMDRRACRVSFHVGHRAAHARRPRAAAAPGRLRGAQGAP